MALFSKTYTGLSLNDDMIVYITLGKEKTFFVKAYGYVKLPKGVVVAGKLKKPKEFLSALRSLKIKQKDVCISARQYPDEEIFSMFKSAKITPIKIFHEKDCIAQLLEGQSIDGNVWVKFFSLDEYVPPITKGESFLYAQALGAIVANM